jgi:hypothetical protein
VFADNISWVGPIEVFGDKFIQKGGVFGIIYSFNEGDCCRGGSCRDDVYAIVFQVDDVGNVIVADWYSEVALLFSSSGVLKAKIKNQWNTQCNPGKTGFAWPGQVFFLDKNKIIISTGYCTTVHSYDGALQWELGASENSFPAFRGFWDGKMIFKNYRKEPYAIGSDLGKINFKDFEDGYLFYDIDGHFIGKSENFEENVVISENSIKLNHHEYKNTDISNNYIRKFFQDNEKLLYVVNKIDGKKDFENQSIQPSGKAQIYSQDSNKIYTLIFPDSKFSKAKRTCGSNDNTFAGRDVIKEYARGVYVTKSGEIYATLYVPDSLKLVKWVKVDLDNKVPVDILSKVSKDGLRILLNEIYARKGRRFKSPDMKAYFTAQPWYKIDKNYTDKKLSKIDTKNIANILKFRPKEN